MIPHLEHRFILNSLLSLLLHTTQTLGTLFSLTVVATVAEDSLDLLVIASGVS